MTEPFLPCKDDMLYSAPKAHNRAMMPFLSPTLTNRRNALKPNRKTEGSRHPTSDIWHSTKN